RRSPAQRALEGGEPGRGWGPSIGPLRASDLALGAGIAFLLVAGTYGASHDQRGARHFDIIAVALLLIVAGALVLRRTHPVAVLEIVFAATFVYFVLGYANGPIWLALIISYVTAVLSGHRTAAAATAIAGFVIFPWINFVVRAGPAPSPSSLGLLAAWLR